jgi:hypothetical protein
MKEDKLCVALNAREVNQFICENGDATNLRESLSVPCNLCPIAKRAHRRAALAAAGGDDGGGAWLSKAVGQGWFTPLLPLRAGSWVRWVAHSDGAAAVLGAAAGQSRGGEGDRVAAQRQSSGRLAGGG